MPAAPADRRPALIEQGIGLPFVFDCSISEQHGVRLQWTREPIESGGELSDNRVVEQRQLIMRILVSSAELGGIDPARHVRAWARFVALATANPPKLFDVTTAIETLEDVVIDEVGMPRTAADGSSVTVDLKVRQLLFSQTDVAANLADAAQDLGLGNVDLGSQGLG